MSKTSPIIGIDLGTTNSLVGAVVSGFPLVLADSTGEQNTPSVVHFREDGSVVVGAAAERMKVLDPARTVHSVKRLIGQRPGEPGWQPDYQIESSGGGLVVRVGARTLTPVEISAEILAELKLKAEESLEVPVTRAVITVPAYFNDAQRKATIAAGEMAGLTVERIVSEPTAAALAYGMDRREGRQKLAVFDLGGGTFDVSILEMNDGVFQVLATAGDTRLGGDDFDRLLVDELWAKFTQENELTERLEETEITVRAQLLDAAKKAKHRLSTDDEVTVELPFFYGGKHLAVVLERNGFEAQLKSFLDRCSAHSRQAMMDADVEPGELTAVLLVGGSTRIPAVRQLVREVFQQEPDTSQNPDQVVAKGAVVQAGILEGSLWNLVLVDVTPLSLGIETFGGLMNVILPRNSTIPAKAGEVFTNAVDGQSAMRIRILQGEREMAKDNWELGRVDVPFASASRGQARVGVQFSIDANGVLEVLARNIHTNQDTVLQIENSAVDVADERVEKMIEESVDHAFEDMAGRVFTEAKLKSDELLPAVDAALAALGDEIDTQMRGQIDAAVVKVRSALDSGDGSRLKAANRELDEATEEMAGLLVERAMMESMERKGLI